MGNVSLLDEHKKKKRNPPDHLVPSGFSAHPAGFEPTACRLGGGRSILLSYGCAENPPGNVRSGGFLFHRFLLI